VYCTNCGVKLADDASFCPNCGVGRWQEAIDDPYSETALVQRGMKLCVACRSEISRAATVCDRCDAVQPLPGEGGSYPQPMPAVQFQQGPDLSRVVPATIYASMGRRIVSFLIDLIVVAMLAVFVLVGIELATGETISTGEGNGNDNNVLILSLFLYLGYFIFTEGIAGQTVGKRLTDIRVVSLDGSKATWSQSVVRNLLRIIDSLPVFYILGLILIANSDQNQRLGDRLGKTIVVHEPRPDRTAT
jgi:uncharacterized RDD family membrane protein YckC